MLIDHEDMADVIDALGDGETALIKGTEIAVWFRPDRNLRISEEEVIEIPSSAYVLAADCQRLGIRAGNQGDIITLRGKDYSIVAMDPGNVNAMYLRLAERP